ncbi:MAG: VCBS repeat-containing protein [Pseudomonadota bacterium]|nr:VCBS repeat-containing protein [Pseudomonadota bacterium]
MTILRQPPVLPRGGVACLLVLVAGCKGCASDDALPMLLEAEDATSVGVWVGEGLGVSPVLVPVYATSALGAAVPSDAITLTSEGAVSGTVTPGADGWAIAEVTTPGRGRYGVQATVGGASADGAAWDVADAPGSIDALSLPVAGDASQIARAAGGVAYALGGEVWWRGWDGAPPTRALALEEPVVRLLSAEIDADGVTDVVAISETRIVLLRGRDDGGLVWGGGWSVAEGRTISAVAIADRNGDSVTDISLALNDGEGSWIYQLDGDGVWGFTPADALELKEYQVYGLSVEDLDGNGVSEVTVLTEDGFLRRYTRIDGTWASTLTGSQFALETGAGGRLWPSVDLTGDGVPELIASGPSLDGTGWVAWVVTAGVAEPSQFPIVSLEGAYPWLGMALGDLTGDGLLDIAFTTPKKLYWAAWNGETFTLTGRRDVPAGPSLELDDVDDDGIVDAILGGTSLRVLHGAREHTEAGADVPNSWAVRAAAPTVFGIKLVAEPAIQDVNGDTVVDVVALVLPSGATSGVALQGFYGVPSTDTTVETIRSGGSLTLTGSGTALDVVVCGTRAYALYEEADDAGVVGAWLARANLAVGLGPTEDGEPIAVQGSALACGEFLEGEVAVADETGGVQYVGADGTVVAGASLAGGAALAAGDMDGDGLDELYACAAPGCSVAVADIDGDGLLDLVSAADAAADIVYGDATLPSSSFDLSGALRVDDADGDGLSDIVIGQDGAVRVIRGVPGGLAPAVGTWTFRPVADAVRYGDLDGDGLPDAFLFGEDPSPDVDVEGDDWVGTLLYARATE